MSDPPTIGPSLPPHLLVARDGKGSDESISKSLVGPQLPPACETTIPPSNASYGPCLPPGMIYGSPIPENESKDTSGY